MSAKRRGLGGITALDRPGVAVAGMPASGGIVSALRAGEGDSARVGSGASLRTLAVGDISPHPDNPRESLGDLSDLVESVRQWGVLQPPVVIPADAFRRAWPRHRGSAASSAWVVIAGHRRLAAAQQADLATIDVVVRGDLATPTAAAAAFVIENVHRAELSPLEEARAYALLADLGLGQREIASQTFVSQSHISKRLSLLRLPQQAQDALTAGTLSISDALQLAALSETDRDIVWDEVRSRHTAVADAVEQLRQTRNRESRVAQARAQAQAEDLEIVDPPVRFGRAYADHRVTEPQDVAAARETEVLVAAISSEGDLEYYSVEAQARPGTALHEHQRRQAATARAHVCRQLVAIPPTPQEAMADLVRITLSGFAAEWGSALRLTHAWLRETDLGASSDDPQEWLASLAAASPADQQWVAWALTVARDETHAAAIHRDWDRETRDHITRLQRHGYSPTGWELDRLRSIPK